MKTIHFIIIAGISLSVMSCKQKQAEMVKNINDIPVQLADVRTQEVANSVTIHGALTTLEEAKLSFKTAGIISRIYVSKTGLPTCRILVCRQCYFIGTVSKCKNCLGISQTSLGYYGIQ